MITITVNDEKQDGSKSIWKLVNKGTLDGPMLIAMVAKICAQNDEPLEIESLRVKT